MRKITLTLIAAFMATVSFGQSKHAPLKLATEKVVSLQQLQTKKSIDPMEKRLQANVLKAKTRSGEDMITETPAGEKQAYERAGGAWINSLFGLSLADQSGWMETVVSEDGKTIYFKDIISSNQAGTWVAGSVNADGSITVPMDQNVVYSASYDAYVTLKWSYFAVSADGTQLIGYGYDPEVKEATLLVDEDGVLTLKDSGIFEDEEGNVVYVGLGLYWTDDDSWYGSLDFGSVYTPGEMPENIPAPETLVVEDYTLKSYDYYGAMSAKLVQAGWDGDDFWIQGLEGFFPEAWVKGTKKGDKVVFDTPQFLGFYSNYSIYLVGGEYSSELDTWVMSETLALDIDEETKTFSMDEDHAMVSNAALDRIYYLTLMAGAKIAPYVEVAATPMTPQVLSYGAYFESYGYDYISASVPNLGTNGEFLDPAKFSYIVYVDGEPFTFYADRMPYVEEDLTEIPYTYTDNFDIGAGGAYLYPYATAFKTIGIKSIYRGGGEVHESDIEYFETGLADANDFAGSNVYCSFDGDEDYCGSIGTGYAESYDVATFVQDANLVGAKVKSMSVLTTGKSEGRSGYNGWISNKLGLTSVDGAKVAAADVTGETTFDGNVMTVTFDEPYEITEDGFFAGYTVKVNSVEEEDDEAPIMLALEPSPYGFFLHTSTVYMNWVEMGSKWMNAILPVILTFEDGTIQEVGARFINTGDYYATINEPTNITVALANNGTTDITSIDYTINVAGQDIEVSKTFEAPISGATYGQQVAVDVEVPALATAGSYPLTLTIDKVNGVANGAKVTADKGQVSIVSFVPKHRVLVEEYTGTWCGYCPRGFVGMKMLSETLGDDFVGVAYHNGDPMASMWANGYGFPNDIDGFPSAFINRVTEVDPYFGINYGAKYFGIYDDVMAEAAKFTPVEVSVKAEYDAESNSVNAVADAKFVASSEDGRYSVEFIAVEDGLSGEDSGWHQKNYYDGYGEDQLGPDMAWLGEAGSAIEGLEFDDVFLFSTFYSVSDEELPAEIVANETYSVANNMSIDYMINEDAEVISQDVRNMKVIALVIDNRTGEVINAAKAKVEVDEVGISNIAAEQTQSKVYNVQGLEVTKGYKGVVIYNGKKYMAK